MSITVVIARDDVGAPSTREVYALGVKFNVENGDLMIITDKPQVVALYGSGNWLSVHVDDHVEVISEKPAEDDGDSGFDFGSDSSFGDDDSSSSDFDFGDLSADSDSTETSSDTESDDADSVTASDDLDFSFDEDAETSSTS